MSKKQRNRGGTWLSASTTTSLHLFPDLSTSHSFPQFASLRDRIHVSCVSQSPVTTRGSRVIFASYKDCVGQIQKFATRFQDSSESLTFINSLKECLAGVCSIRLPSNNFRSENLSRNDFAAATGLHHELQYTFCLETTVPHEGGVISTLLPTSFTAFLADGCTEAQQGAKTIECRD